MAQPFHPQKGPNLRDLRPDERFIGFYTIRNKQLEPFRDPTRGHFLSLTLSDASGQMIARIWEDAEAAAEELDRGQVIKVEGETETFQNRTQIRILRYRIARPDEYDPRDFIPSSSLEPEQLLSEIRAHIEQISDPNLHSLVDYFFSDQAFLERFSQAPETQRVHHAYLGGLLEHTVETLAICRVVMSLYPQIDASLLLAGALLHDIGKTEEFSWDLDFGYTDQGRLLGHVMIADQMISQALRGLPDFPPTLALRLRHLLLAHHGRYEWGSPREPQTLEAIALHQAHELVAQVNRFSLLLERKPPGETWTSYDRLLGRQLYAGEEDDDDGGGGDEQVEVDGNEIAF